MLPLWLSHCSIVYTFWNPIHNFWLILLTQLFRLCLLRNPIGWLFYPQKIWIKKLSSWIADTRDICLGSLMKWLPSLFYAVDIGSSVFKRDSLSNTKRTHCTSAFLGSCWRDVKLLYYIDSTFSLCWVVQTYLLSQFKLQSLCKSNISFVF